MNTLVSAIVASYNHAEYLQQRMDSLLKQTYPNLEIIIIDDCSTDNSIEILKGYTKYPNVTLHISPENSGWVAVSNRGAQLSKGEYIVFANCDDYCEPDQIASLAAILDANSNAGLAYSRSILVDKTGTFFGDDLQFREASFRAFCKSDVLIPKGTMRKFLLHSCVIPNLSAALIRKSAFLFAGSLPSKYRICADWELYLQMTEYNSFFYTPRALNYFRNHHTTIRSSLKANTTILEYFDVFFSWYRKTAFGPVEKAAFRKRCAQLWMRNIKPVNLERIGTIVKTSRQAVSVDFIMLLYLSSALVADIFRYLFLRKKSDSKID